MAKRYKKAAWGYLPMGTETVRVNPRTANALKTRGGFSLPPKATKHVANIAGHLAAGNHKEAKQAVKQAAFETAKGVGLKAVHSIITEERNPRPLRRGKRTAEPIDAPGYETSAVNHGCHTEEIPSKTRQLGAMSSTIHKTYVETGRPTTNSVWNVAKQNGIIREVMHDSKIAASGDQYAFSRNQLDHSSGFNSRNFVVPGPAAYANLTDIHLQMDLDSTDRASRIKDQKFYALLMDSTSEFQFHNQSSYHDMTLKVHLVKQRAMEPINTPAVRIAADTVSTNPTPAGQEIQAVPYFYQHSSPSVSLGNSPDTEASTMMDVDMSVKGSGFNMSNDFRSNFKIVKTVSKKLGAGDIWNFRHTHYYGSGFEMSPLFNAFYEGVESRPGEKYAPANYFYIFEACGRECEGVLHEPQDVYETYIGKSPSYYTFECRKALRYASRPRTASDINEFGLSTATGMAMKFYSSDPMRLKTATQEFFKLPGNITNSLSSVPVGNMYIPVMSDSVLSTELAKSRAQDD